MSSEDEATLTIHGLEAFNEAVDAEVFAEKLKAFLTALAIADTAANGTRRHKYMISALEKNTATAGIREHEFKSGPPVHSSVQFYRDGLNRIQAGDPTAKLLPKNFIKNIAILNRGVGKTFAFGEIKFRKSETIRIDDVMRHQAVTLLNEVERLEKSNQKFFKGYAIASFDGVLKTVDLRGDMKTAYLILTAGGSQIDCNITSIDVDLVREALDKRAIVSGMAHYRGDSGLPSRIEIRNVKIVDVNKGDLKRWRGAFSIEKTNSDFEWGL